MYCFYICIPNLVSAEPEPVNSFSWYRDELPIEDSERYVILRETAVTCQLLIRKVEFVDQAEWKCVASNDYGTSVTSCFLKLQIPRHYKKPKFLECLRAILTAEGAVNLECKVIVFFFNYHYVALILLHGNLTKCCKTQIQMIFNGYR